jgi:hypothetical protein
MSLIVRHIGTDGLGTHRELLAAGGLFAKLHGLQPV